MYLQQLLFRPLCWGCGETLKKQEDFCFSCRRDLFRQLEKSGFLWKHKGAVTGLLSCLRGTAPHKAATWSFAFLHRRGFVEEWKAMGFQQLALAPQNPKKETSGLVLLGEMLSGELKIPILEPFEKIGARTQHGRSLAARMDTACFIRMREQGEWGKVLLIDDVHTSGTTLDLCSYLLMQAGAKEVEKFCLARQMVPRLEGKHSQASHESQEVDPLLLHLFM